MMESKAYGLGFIFLRLERPEVAREEPQRRVRMDRPALCRPRTGRLAAGGHLLFRLPVDELHH